MRYLVALAFLCACSNSEPAPASIIGPSDAGADQIGQRAPALDGVRWLGGDAGRSDAGGDRLHLVRWWTDGCSLCSGSAPELTRIAAAFPDDLRFSAVFHDKRGRATIDDAWLRETAAATGFDSCRIGVDPGWAALRAWWLDRGGRRFTSVTFLLDREGVIRLIHTGGTVTSDEASAIERMVCYVLASQ